MSFEKAQRTFLMAGMATVLAGSCNADVDSGRYTSITLRNAFALRPPPPPAEIKAPPPPPSVTVKLTGIISGLLPIKKAILVITEPGKQPVSKVMAEKDHDAIVEVKEIDHVAGMVKVVAGGKDMDLEFDKSGDKAGMMGGGSPAPTAGFGQPLGSTTPSVLSGIAPLGNNASIGSFSSFLNKASMAASSAASSSPLASSPMGIGLPGANANNVPGFRFDADYKPNVSQPKWPPEQQVSAEESHIFIELQRMRGGPPPPPTAITPDEQRNQLESPPGFPPAPGG